MWIGWKYCNGISILALTGDHSILASFQIGASMPKDYFLSHISLLHGETLSLSPSRRLTELHLITTAWSEAFMQGSCLDVKRTVC